MKHVKLNNGHQLAILNLIDLEVFRGIHVYFMNITGMLVTLSQTSQFFIVIVIGHTTLRQLEHCKILHHVPVTCALSTIIYLGAGAML